MRAVRPGRCFLLMSGGCEGIMSPHATVFVRRPASLRAGSSDKRLTFAAASTRELLPEELGTMVQVDLVAAAVREAVRDAGIADLNDVHYVQVKCPLLTTRTHQRRQGAWPTDSHRRHLTFYGFLQRFVRYLVSRSVLASLNA